jgi:hypothetical protein
VVAEFVDRRLKTMLEKGRRLRISEPPSLAGEDGNGKHDQTNRENQRSETGAIKRGALPASNALSHHTPPGSKSGSKAHLPPTGPQAGDTAPVNSFNPC